jgi:hypothetical protein
VCSRDLSMAALSDAARKAFFMLPQGHEWQSEKPELLGRWNGGAITLDAINALFKGLPPRG